MLTTLLVWALIGLIAGFIAEMFTKGNHNWVTNIIVGIVGAMLGGWLSTLITGRGVEGLDPVSLLIAAIGAIILVFLVRAVTAGRGRSAL
jgi:uncharacterized membrane protein YeaQ/YmgE (transglycosylase-associated protein family)